MLEVCFLNLKKSAETPKQRPQAIRRNTQKHPIKNPKQKHPAPLLQATILRGGGRETDGFQYTILLLSAFHL